MNLSHRSKINRRQTTAFSTRRKCPHCKEVLSTSISGRFFNHKFQEEWCPVSGFSPSEWKVEKPEWEARQLEREMIQKSRARNALDRN